MLELDLMPPVYELITPRPLEPASLGLHASVKTIEALEARLPQGLRSEGAAVQSLYQTGQASWYGDKFHGRLTANGERYNMYAMTAAHRTLPFGTIVCVRSLQTSKEIKVRINDRGPYVGQRIIDLSRGAAEKLGMLSQGLKNVALWIPQKNGPQCGEDDVLLEGKGAPPPHNPPRGLSASTPAQTPAQGSAAKGPAKNTARKPAKGVAQRAAKNSSQSSAKKTQNTKTPKAARKPARANAKAR
ncbi:septal ring lytic transglycosylase RlpA family protein [Allofranklinella schreckenbergeri]|uniref:Endolytic peptidoglycan transglycosylase RlpA n=2 Tax=Allofranklinella schreckenbergeri TaxID=1076744 RepID=A0A3M6QWR4_9BURK|nr:septal ring lytic transglycosylase RlpA family protein [Allofranklinella schreckenbergeri]